MGPCTLWFIRVTRGFRDGQGEKDECVVPNDVRDAKSWACPVAPGVVVPSGMIFRRVRARVPASQEKCHREISITLALLGKADQYTENKLSQHGRIPDE